MSTANRNSESPQNSPAAKASKGVMNCKPCQIRKIKCDRALPACGVCHLYQRSCFYEGVPKKRGPKKESLSALIKRIDGLEELLKSEKTPTPPGTDIITSDFSEPNSYRPGTSDPCGSASSDISPFSTLRGGIFEATSEVSATLNAEGLVDVYFSNFHRNPYEILDEANTRRKLATHQLPKSVLYAICAVATGFSERPGRGPSSHVTMETYAAWSQRDVDPCEASLDSCQALLLLVSAFAAVGNGKRAYALLSQAVGMAMTLELHSQPNNHDGSQLEHELNRKLFWTCYVMNGFVSAWLERPSLMDDSLIKADIQSSQQSFPSSWGSASDLITIPHGDAPSSNSKNPAGELRNLVWLSQILSEANRYILLSDTASQAAYCQRHKIMHDLDLWASSISRSSDPKEQTSEGSGQNLSFVCKMTFHLIHCLIHRPILPLRLSESSGIKMIQHWVVEATETAFRHATAIVELASLTRETSTQPLPAFAGFCIFTAATILNHGVYYADDQNPQGLGVRVAPFAGSPMSASFFASSPELLSRSVEELSILSDTITSARLFILRLEELKAEHVALLNGKAAGYVPKMSNRFFQRYSTTLLKKIHGIHTGDTIITNQQPFTQSPPPITQDEKFRKDSISNMNWEANQSLQGGKLPFHPPRSSIAPPSSHHSGHHRSFSDSLSLSQSYSFDTSQMSHKQHPQHPTWPGFQDATPRQRIEHGSSIMDPSIQLTSPICQREGVIGGGQGGWGDMKAFSGGEQVSYEVLAGSVATAGPPYQQQEGLGTSFIPFQNFSVP